MSDERKPCQTCDGNKWFYGEMCEACSGTGRATPPSPSTAPTCQTCGGSRVDPGGLPICRDCGTAPTVDERADFEAWADLTAQQRRGVEHDLTGWYYFDDEVEGRWQAWKASAARRQPSADGAALDLPPLPERDGDWAGDDWWTADSMRQFGRDAIAHYQRKQAGQPEQS